MTRFVAPDRDIGLQGHDAGIVTRLAGFVIDVVLVVILYDVVVRIVEILVSTVAGIHFSMARVPVAPWVLLLAAATLYCVLPVAAGGRTLGMTIVGLRVVRADGMEVGNREALVRFLTLPLSFLTLGGGFLLILFRRDGRALHDLISGTSVVYGWDARAARLRFLVKEEGTQLVE